jgi:hypothetical protein
MNNLKFVIICLIVLMSTLSAYPSDNKQKEDISQKVLEEGVKNTEVVYQIPFGSSNNVIELSVENGSEFITENIKVKIVNPPDWIKFKSVEQNIQNIKSNSENTVSYIFSIDKEAPVNTQQALNFNITTPSGEIWNKQITISINAPETYKLYQNYPNPFNPTTIISYQLPVSSNVTLKIFDILGREVATIVDEFRKAGYYKEVWDASNYASGVYFYKIAYNKFTSIKKLAVVK